MLWRKSMITKNDKVTPVMTLVDIMSDYGIVKAISALIMYDDLMGVVLDDNVRQVIRDLHKSCVVNKVPMIND